jgi:hypothetical protein
VLGVPTCAALALEPPWKAPGAMWFVGDVSPRGHLLQMVVGTARLAARARDAGAATVVSDRHRLEVLRPEPLRLGEIAVVEA